MVGGGGGGMLCASTSTSATRRIPIFDLHTGLSLISNIMCPNGSDHITCAQRYLLVVFYAQSI